MSNHQPAMSPQRLRILWVKSGPLLPANTGGRIRTLQMLRAMSRDHDITFLAQRDTSLADDEDKPGADYAQRRLFEPWRDPPRGSPRFALGALFNLGLSSLPYALAKYRSVKLAARIRAMDASGEFDLLVCDFLTPGPWFDQQRGHTPRVIFQHNVEAQIWQRMAENEKRPLVRQYLRLQHARMEHWEKKLCQRFDGVITVSPEDSRISRERYQLGNVLGDVPAGVDTEYFAGVRATPATEPVIGFLGSMDWLPNIEGIRWFVEQALPAVRKQVPGVKLLVIGRNPPEALKRLALADPLIEFTGTVADVRPSVTRCQVMIVPLLAGGGTRIKLLEIMAAGRAVVSTTVGAEGLGLKHERHLLLADEAQSFTAAVIQLLADVCAATAMSERAWNEAAQPQSWQAAGEKFVALARGVLA
ncbi:MAG: hypothetical protein JWO94_1051 [Verrucomicrobiaceae bacterium]|nr:hypothetical protein [Verrucomicrobiaceae bacterium]